MLQMRNKKTKEVNYPPNIVDTRECKANQRQPFLHNVHDAKTSFKQRPKPFDTEKLHEDQHQHATKPTKEHGMESNLHPNKTKQNDVNKIERRSVIKIEHSEKQGKFIGPRKQKATTKESVSIRIHEAIEMHKHKPVRGVTFTDP